MFNFFDEIKRRVGENYDVLSDFNVVNMSGKILYVEGHKGITVISSSMIAFKIKKGRIVVEGKELSLNELTQNTILIRGKIDKVEMF